MAYYDSFRKNRNINDPIVPIPRFIPPAGSGASVGALDAGIAQETQFNKQLFSPGGLSPYYGGRSYTQAAQSSAPMTPRTYAPPAPPSPLGWHSPSASEATSIQAQYGTPGSSTPPSSGPSTAPSVPVNYAGNMVGGVNYLGQPVPGMTSTPTTPTTGVTQPPGNAIQRWQSHTALDERPASPPGPMYGMSSQRRYYNYTGRIDARPNVSPNERMPYGGTSVKDWRKFFGNNTQQ